MKTLAIRISYILFLLFLISCENGIHIFRGKVKMRIQNNTMHTFDSLEYYSGVENSSTLRYTPLTSGESTERIKLEGAYSYATRINVFINREKEPYWSQAIDFVGESQIDGGKYLIRIDEVAIYELNGADFKTISYEQIKE